MVVFDLHVFILDLMKNSNGNDNIIQKLNFNKKILNAFVIKNKLMIIFTDGEIITYILNIKDEENNNDKNEEKEDEESSTTISIEPKKFKKKAYKKRNC